MWGERNMANANREALLKEAFGYHHPLVTYAYALLRDHAQAEDAVQNAYVVITKKCGDFTPGTSVLAWARSIVRFEVLQIMRKRGREQPAEYDVLISCIADTFEQVQTPDRVLVRLERSQRLQHCLARLPQRSRDLVRGRYLDGLGLKALAEQATMSVSAVRKSIYRIRLALRQCMEREGVAV
jgi:RNA polymerase sigma-70 factor, ECF subfamily